MASRHLARVISLQTLYTWDFLQTNIAKSKVSEKFDANEILEYNLQEFGPDIKGEEEFIRSLVTGVFKHWEKINDHITELAPEWPLPQINTVDRNVLRLGIFELKHGDADAVPPKVAINEAIELAKNFGGPSSGRFVNGVLGTFYNQIKEERPELAETEKHVKGEDKKENETKPPLDLKDGESDQGEKAEASKESKPEVQKQKDEQAKLSENNEVPAPAETTASLVARERLKASEDRGFE